MFNMEARTAIILGAGFSKNAYLPLQNEFPKLLLSDVFNSDLEVAITAALKDFFKKTFDWTPEQELPSLEDVFTFIDLSAGTGHSLGRQYTPKKLRAIRRMLIHRLFTIIDSRYRQSPEILELLNYYIQRNAHFISLNWDIVLEKHLELTEFNPRVDYCVYSKPWNNTYDNRPNNIAIAKVHGSSNWVYCDNCKSLFYDRSNKLSLTIRAGIIKSDFRLFDERITGNNFRDLVEVPPMERNCQTCNCAVGPLIATFSMKKAFRTHVFNSTWLAAEQLLDKADRWVFIGYSLPDADFEFKHLLKSCQLKLQRKEIHSIVLNDNLAENRFISLFGRRNVRVFQGGLEEYNNYLANQ